MVRGIELFKEYFSEFVDCFILIGGAACELTLTNTIGFRATYIYFFVVPTGIAVICTLGFSIGGIKDMFRLFKDLQTWSKINIEDNGRVDHETYLKD